MESLSERSFPHDQQPEGNRPPPSPVLQGAQLHFCRRHRRKWMDQYKGSSPLWLMGGFQRHLNPDPGPFSLPGPSHCTSEQHSSDRGHHSSSLPHPGVKATSLPLHVLSPAFPESGFPFNARLSPPPIQSIPRAPHLLPGPFPQPILPAAAKTIIRKHRPEHASRIYILE